MDFKRGPSRIHGGSAGQVTGLELQKNELVRDTIKGSVRAQGTGQMQTLECQMVLGSIGYCSVPLPGVPFDPTRGIVPNRYDQPPDLQLP